jgi:GTP 3',8-cyclase
MSDVPSKITDAFGRTFDYLRIAVTERCNLRCQYCMPEEGVDFKHGERILSAEELIRVVSVLRSVGVKKVRLTGGEPLVRKDILSLVKGLADLSGIESLHMTSNGLLFEKFAQPLLDAGLTGVNFSLDTFDEEKFKKITRRSGSDKVLAAIDRSLELGFTSVKVNVVAMRGFNDDEFYDFVALTRDRPITVRFIELMPFDAEQIWKTGKFLKTAWLQEKLNEHYPELGETVGSSTEHAVYHVAGHQGKVALIPAYSRTLCSACSRIRLTADGQIRNCLYSVEEFDLRGLLRGGASDDDIRRFFLDAMGQKVKDGWEAQERAKELGRKRTSMTQIGG